MSYQMYKESLQDVRNYCEKCKPMANLRTRHKVNPLLNTATDMQMLGDMREQCARCRGFSGMGIYKADAILATYSPPQLPPGRGKRCTIPNEIQNRIYERHKAGETQRKIADSIGVSRSSVQRVVARLKSINEQKGE